jgi:transcriptional regulator with XRE-family HTH domain
VTTLDRSLEKDEVPAFLVMLRQRYDLGQGDLARALGVSRASIAHYEHGRRVPNVARRRRIVEYARALAEAAHAPAP